MVQSQELEKKGRRRWKEVLLRKRNARIQKGALKFAPMIDSCENQCFAWWLVLLEIRENSENRAF